MNTSVSNSISPAKNDKPVREPVAHPPCVLQLIPSLDAGGAERACLDMAAWLHQQGGRSLVASQGGRMEAELAALGGTLIRLPIHSKNPLIMLVNGFRLAWLARVHAVDLIHARSRAPAWSGLLAGWLCGAPMLTTFHGFYGAGNWLKRFYNSVMVRGARVIAGSHFMAAHIAAAYAPPLGRIAMIARGINLRHFDPGAVSSERVAALRAAWRIPDRAHIVLLPGRLTSWKGQLLLIEALARLKRSDVTGVLAGDSQGRDAYVEELWQLARQHGIDGQLRVTGNAADMPAAYKLADIIVSASTDAEAFGRAPVEAMAMGCTVIAADHGGASETLRPQDGGPPFGILFTPGDAAALTAALQNALSQDAAMDEGRMARARAHVSANYSDAVMCAKTYALYLEILAQS